MKTKIKVSVEAQSLSEIVSSIDDLLIQILLYLPIKSLIRFKSVSKHWNSLVDDPRFCLLRNPNPNPAVGIFFPCSFSGFNPWIEYVPFSGIKSSNPPFSKLGFNKRPSDIRIICSCNGLLLCSTTRDCNNLASRYYVYNPTSNKFSTLPKLDGEEDWISSQICGMNLAFDPAKSPHYKVVCIRSWRYMYQLEVYSSETVGPWRKCGEPFKAQVIFQTGVYWNGAIHWIMNGFRNSLHSWDSRDSLYFNVDDEILRVMPLLPLPDASNWKSNYRFWESCDHLHYIIDIIRSSISFNVYEMRQDYSEWFIKYRVDLSPVVAAFPEMIRSNPINFHMDWRNRPIYAICSLVRGEKDEDSFLVLNIEGKAIRYNIVYQTFETIFEFVGAEVEGRERFLGRIGYQYIESLCGV